MVGRERYRRVGRKLVERLPGHAHEEQPTSSAVDVEQTRLLHEVAEGLHGVRREMAVLTERLTNEKDARDIFAVSYERRHAELQQQASVFQIALNSAERERELLRVDLTEMKTQLSHVEGQVNSINSSIRWIVYLVIGLIITAVITAALSGKWLH